MKITRLKQGYRISLSDGEFEALEHLVNHGIADSEGDRHFDDILSVGAKRALRSGRFASRDAMGVDEDRRQP